MDDILIELSDNDLEQLARMYERHCKELPYLYSFLQICVKSKKIDMPDFVKVWSPNNCWKIDGTFIASVPNHGHDIILHSFDSSGKNLIEGLSKTKKFKYLRDPARSFTLFYAVDPEFYPKILQLLNEQKHKILSNDASDVWVLNKENATKIQEDNEKVYVKNIQLEDLSVVNNHWPFKYPESEQKLMDLSKLTKGLGVYLKSNNQLISWVVCSRLGQMGALQTLGEYRFKGYAALAVKNMAKTLAEAGFDCCGSVDRGNVASERLLSKLGFKKLRAYHYIAVQNEY
ncbi:unnamed protein product [Ceutorhynchus assimilis]|uniref:N-acetyltransferase domain-containing protein n=1 Tax=Ceutorhynchus assimilis TaxID=467358 RepID=A0A9N9MBC5_9CUCU|nr:unnamed protein product [Ceutorhynchus assimilis]